MAFLFSSFSKKIIIKQWKNEPLKEKASDLIDKRNKLINQKGDPQNSDKIYAITEAIAEEEVGHMHYVFENHKRFIQR